MAIPPPATERRRVFLTDDFAPRSQVQVVMARMRFLPMVPMMTFLIGTFVLFLLWPINWPIYGLESWLILSFVISASFAAVFWGYVLGSRDTGRLNEPIQYVSGVVVAGGILSVVLLVPSSYVYTDRWPWEILDALRNQGDAYRRYQQTLIEGTGQRGLIAFVRAISAPLVFGAVPLGIIHWQRLGISARAATVATAIASLWFSIMRGTDKEFADLFVLMSSAILILIVRQGRANRVIGYIRAHWVRLLIITALAIVAVNLFNSRKSERVGGLAGVETLTRVCANNSRICADLSTPLISWMPQSQQFGISFFILSATQGYYGASLALEKDFQSTLGVGHSPAMRSVYELVTGDRQWHARTYTYRNGFQNWSEENFWSSLITWLANDVGFPGAVVILGFVGFAWGRSWIRSAIGGSDPAAVIFCQIMIVMLYLPANNQVYASYDGYTVTMFWGFWWLFQRQIAAQRSQQ